MANTVSAAKNARKAERRHTLRVAVKSELKTLRKKTLALAEEKKPEVKDVMKTTIKKLAKAASNKYIHPRTASRKISRTMKAVNKAAKETGA